MCVGGGGGGYQIFSFVLFSLFSRPRASGIGLLRVKWFFRVSNQCTECEKTTTTLTGRCSESLDAFRFSLHNKQREGLDAFIFFFKQKIATISSCLWSLMIFPSLPGSRLRIFIAIQVQHSSYTSPTNTSVPSLSGRVIAYR